MWSFEGEDAEANGEVELERGVYKVCLDEFDIEGLIVSTGCSKKTQSNTEMLDKIVDADGKVLPNLYAYRRVIINVRRGSVIIGRYEHG